ncbi:MAG TPA: TIGR00725 family protein [Cyclobacteriaceae bacterium]|nr:TIGR00725 family protein [Cyclobacteriaceae bacterium]
MVPGGSIIIGVMGPGETASPEVNNLAYELGKEIARHGWAVLSGGRSFGVMDASMRGATEHGGLTIGVLPSDDGKEVSPHAKIRIITGMGSARNYINILSSHVIVVCGIGAGTASEIALALKSNKKVILLQPDKMTFDFFKKIGDYKINAAENVAEAIHMIQNYLAQNQKRN